jgi:hypothetical protein
LLAEKRPVTRARRTRRQAAWSAVDPKCSVLAFDPNDDSLYFAAQPSIMA